MDRGQPSVGVLGGDRPVTRPVIRRLVLVAVAAALLGGCNSGAGTPTPPPDPTQTTTLPRAAPPPRPPADGCYRLGWEAAIAPTNGSSMVRCGAGITARTFHVGRLDTVVDGHLLTVDSASVQARIATDCTNRLAGYLDADADDLALSMFRAVWFSPTLEESDAGADWYRCDVIALARDGRLARLPARVAGTLGATDALDTWGTCGTAEPGSKGFAQVRCSAPHAWRAIAIVRHPGSAYPGAKALTADREECEHPARAAAADPLSVKFSYLAPTREQWRAGRHYGTCWVPTD